MKIIALIYIDYNDRNKQSIKIDDTSKVKADDYCYRAKLIHLICIDFEDRNNIRIKIDDTWRLWERREVLLS